MFLFCHYICILYTYACLNILLYTCAYSFLENRSYGIIILEWGGGLPVIYSNLMRFTGRGLKGKDILKTTSQQNSGLLTLVEVFFLVFYTTASLYTLS